MITPLLHNKGSLITVTRPACLGFLIDFQDRGVYDAELGRVDVTPEEAKTHNALLSKAQIDGLDQNCEVGMGGTFYFIDGKIQTWTGELVSRYVQRDGNTVIFDRNGKRFQGELDPEADCFSFERIA